MNNIDLTVTIRARLNEQTLPRYALWRLEGDYADAGACDGCGERITSAQASYTVDFAPGVFPNSVKMHRMCFEVWQCECHGLPAAAND